MRGDRGKKRLFSERFQIVFAEAVVCEASFDSTYLFFVPEAKERMFWSVNKFEKSASFVF
jgi:hypothetical protein